MENPNTDSEEREQDAAEEALADSQEGRNDSRPWYPYITKAQFEKFLARLQSRIPDEIDRDYIRAIIRTPSMIHRFLRGIEAMKLIDDDQKPTDRLQKTGEPGHACRRRRRNPRGPVPRAAQGIPGERGDGRPRHRLLLPQGDGDGERFGKQDEDVLQVPYQLHRFRRRSTGSRWRQRQPGSSGSPGSGAGTSKNRAGTR